MVPEVLIVLTVGIGRQVRGSALWQWSARSAGPVERFELADPVSGRGASALELAPGRQPR